MEEGIKIYGGRADQEKSRTQNEKLARSLLSYSDTVRTRREELEAAEESVREAELRLARFIALETDLSTWSMLSGEQADEVISSQPDGEGAFGVYDRDEAADLNRIWTERTGVKPDEAFHLP